MQRDGVNGDGWNGCRWKEWMQRDGVDAAGFNEWMQLDAVKQLWDGCWKAQAYTTAHQSCQGQLLGEGGFL